MLSGIRIGKMTMDNGIKILRSVRRYRRKKYASRPHFWMKSEFDVRKTGPIHVIRPLGGAFVRSRSGTRYVLGELVHVSFEVTEKS